ncbi:hypothetical protein EIP91_007325 [Steccherinum ochraceum]|uniref:Uncharacterized protein n=1 Tax=Steccherinum ochraceum TaxID=92696 RepID=A0A4R0S281_9APHY|nr:hypothetical protein EIP91_007325 [Steccherinum ochraceum]
MATHSPLPCTLSPRLPFDVLEGIVGHLAINPGSGFIGYVDANWEQKIRALKACSLVCRELLHSSRRHLFRDVSLRSAEELKEFITLCQRLPWLADCISLLYVYGSAYQEEEKDQSWISTLPFRLFSLVQLKDIRFHNVDLTRIHSSAYKAFHLHGPQSWTFSAVACTRYAQITRLLPATTTRLSVLDSNGRIPHESGQIYFHHLRRPLQVDWTSPRTSHVLPVFNLSVHTIPRSELTFRSAALRKGYHCARSDAVAGLLKIFREFCARQRCSNQINLQLDLYQHDHRSQLQMIRHHANNTLVIEIRARSLSCIATFPIIQALYHTQSALFTSLRIRLCNEYSSRYCPEANPPLLDMPVLTAHWKGVDAVLARTNLPNIKTFSFQCCLEAHVLPEDYACTNELIRGLLPIFTSAVLLEGPTCKPCHGSDARCAYHRPTKRQRPPRLSFAVLERVLGYLSPDSESTKEDARALSACSLASRVLLDYSRQLRFSTCTLRTEKDLVALTTVLTPSSPVSRYITHVIVRPTVFRAFPWISDVPFRLLPLLPRLRKLTLARIDLRFLDPSAYPAFREHGPVEWMFIHIKYARYAQVTQLLPTNTTYLRVDDSEPLGPRDDQPGAPDFTHVRTFLKIDWHASWRYREGLAKSLTVGMLPRAGFDFLMGGFERERRARPEDSAVLGGVRDTFVESCAAYASGDDVHLHYVSGKCEITQVSMWRAGGDGAYANLQLRVETDSLGSVTTSHVAEPQRHNDDDPSQETSSSDIQTLVKLWENIDTTLALDSAYLNLRKFEVQCHLRKDMLPTGYTCTNELIGDLLPKATSRLGLQKRCVSYHAGGRWHSCAYHGWAFRSHVLMAGEADLLVSSRFQPYD